MGAMKVSRQKGFTIVEFLMILTAVILIIGLGLIILHKHQGNTAIKKTSSFTGIYGTVTNGGCAGPISVSGNINHCYSAPQANMIVVAINQANQTVLSALTNSQGKYQLSATPGTYAVNTHP